MKDKYVLDSSIWIEIERGKTKIIKEVQSLILKNQVCLIDVIVAEVLRGVRTKMDFDLLQESFSSYNILSTNWLKVAELAFDVSKKGFQPPLVDIYIAQCVAENTRTLITQGKHFAAIKKVRNFEVINL